MNTIKKCKINTKENNSAIIIQKTWRGYIYRRKNLPNSLLTIKKYLDNNKIKICNIDSDGRHNSKKDEENILQKLKEKFPNRLVISKERHWYDVKFKDYKRGYLPIDVKSTYCSSSDNINGLSTLLYSLTNEKMDLDKSYNNGKVYKILVTKLKNKEYNYSNRDYYFLVINKKTKATFFNSIKGITTITPNNNNLPFQVNWSKNSNYRYKPIKECIKNIIKLICDKTEKFWLINFFKELKIINEDI
jgi:hypothetical protein